MNTVLDDLHDWHGVDFDEALRHSFSRVMQHAKKRSIGVISAHRSGDERDNEKDAQCSARFSRRASCAQVPKQ